MVRGLVRAAVLVHVPRGVRRGSGLLGGHPGLAGVLQDEGGDRDQVGGQAAEEVGGGRGGALLAWGALFFS